MPPFFNLDSCRARKLRRLTGVRARGRNPERSEGLTKTIAAGPVSRILSAARKERQGDHSSRPYITVRLQRPTRKLWRTEPARRPRRTVLPYLVLLRVGFSLPPPLLEARCALTAPFHPYPDCSGRYLFCGTFRKRPLKAAPRTLSGTPLCGVRTFLFQPAQPEPRAHRSQTGSDRPAQQLTEPL
jgi:hypothetical protein